MRRKKISGGNGAGELLADLNTEQVEAVTHQDGPILVAAVAGAGKTRALVHRVAHLVRVAGVDAARILAVTFSKKAADEMNERLVKLLGTTSARVGTFHSFALELLRRERPAYKEWTIDDRDRYRIFVKDAVGFRNLNWREADVTKLCAYIGFAKACLVKPGVEASQQLAEKYFGRWQAGMADDAYRLAERRRVDERFITFDDMLTIAVDLLNEEEVLARWQARYDYVLQDEAQDVNLAQNAIASSLSREHRNYMVVGDPMQTIYAFRGAQPEHLLEFEGAWGSKVVMMARNYRCGKAIVEVANKVAKPATKRLPMDIVAECEHEGTVTFSHVGTMDDEGNEVVSTLREEHASGRRWKDCAILYRTNAQSRGPEEALLKAKVPYVIIGGTNFYDRKEVKDVLAYLRLMEGRGKTDDVRRCINAPFRYLGRAFVERVMALRGDTRTWPERIRDASQGAGIQRRQQAAAEDWAHLIESVGVSIAQDKRPADILEDLLQKTGYLDWLRREEGEESPENSRVSNVRELVRAAARFESVKELLDYIDEVIRDARRAKQAAQSGERPDRVVLTTIHRSKGLEWGVVFVVGMNEGILPHGRTEDEEEERRLAYVAFTRAKDALHVSAVKQAALGSRVVELEVSRYVRDADLIPMEAAQLLLDDPTEA